MSKIVVEYRFTFHQKLIILISVVMFILFVMSHIIEYFEVNELILLSFLIMIYPFLIVLAFLKKGFVVKKGNCLKLIFL